MWHGAEGAMAQAAQLQAPSLPEARRGSVYFLIAFPSLGPSPGQGSCRPASEASPRPAAELSRTPAPRPGPARRGGSFRRGCFPRCTARRCPPGDGKGNSGVRLVASSGSALASGQLGACGAWGLPLAARRTAGRRDEGLVSSGRGC